MSSARRYFEDGSQNFMLLEQSRSRNFEDRCNDKNEYKLNFDVRLYIYCQHLGTGSRGGWAGTGRIFLCDPPPYCCWKNTWPTPIFKDKLKKPSTLSHFYDGPPLWRSSKYVAHPLHLPVHPLILYDQSLMQVLFHRHHIQILLLCIRFFLHLSIQSSFCSSSNPFILALLLLSLLYYYYY